MAERMKIVVSSDGSCINNPGPGGYAAILRYKDNKKEIVGNEIRSTNNRMEIRALIEAVAVLKKPCDILVRTDSNVLINCIAKLEERSQNGWKTTTGARVANDDLHKKLFALKKAGNHEIRYQKVEAHSGDADNERCDMLAKEQARFAASLGL